MRQKNFLIFNHHRIFTHNSFELLLLKHGWLPLFSTYKNLSGPTRPNTIFTIAIKKEKLKRSFLIILYGVARGKITHKLKKNIFLILSRYK